MVAISVTSQRIISNIWIVSAQENVQKVASYNLRLLLKALEDNPSGVVTRLPFLCPFWLVMAQILVSCTCLVLRNVMQSNPGISNPHIANYCV